MNQRLVSWMKVCAVALLLSGVCSQALADDEVNPSGTWDIKVDTDDGQTLEMALTLNKGEEDFESKFVAMDGTEVTPDSLEVEGSNLKFQITVDFGGTDLIAKFDGKIEGGKYTGNVEYDLGGQVGELPFEGQLHKCPAVGTWAVTIDTGDGQTLESTLMLSEADGQLGGKFVAMDGSEVEPEELKSEGDNLAFKITLDFGGTPLVANFDGKIAEGKYCGNIEYDLGGQVGEATFESVRKASPAIGSWDLQIDTGDGQVLESTLTLAETDGVLGGKFLAMDGSEVEPEELKSEGDNLAFKITLDFGGTALVANFDGKIEEDKFSGNIEYDLGGQVGEATFEGARKKAAGLGKWNFMVETDDGQTLESTLTIVEKDGKLVGEFVGQDGTESTTDTLTMEGDNLAFQITLDFGGAQLVAKFDGKIDGDKYAGNVEYDLDGQVGELPVSATRAAADDDDDGDDEGDDDSDDDDDDDDDDQ